MKVLNLIAGIFVISGCAKSVAFKEIQLHNAGDLHVVGYGTGTSNNPGMAAQKARVNAMSNLINQLNGLDFYYQRSDKAVNFTTSSKGILNRTEEVASHKIGENTILTVLSSPMPRADFDPANAFLLQTNFRTENLEKSLTEKYKLAVEHLISSRFKNRSTLSGKLHLTNISLSDWENTTDFAVSIEVLITLLPQEN